MDRRYSPSLLFLPEVPSSSGHVAVVAASFPSAEDPVADGVVVVVDGAADVAGDAAVVVADVVDEAVVAADFEGVELVELAGLVEPVGLVGLVETAVGELHFALASCLLPSVHDHSSSEGRHL